MLIAKIFLNVLFISSLPYPYLTVPDQSFGLSLAKPYLARVANRISGITEALRHQRMLARLPRPLCPQHGKHWVRTFQATDEDPFLEPGQILMSLRFIFKVSISGLPRPTRVCPPFGGTHSAAHDLGCPRPGVMIVLPYRPCRMRFWAAPR